MKTILQFAFAAMARLDMATLRNIWAAIEQLVSGFELAKFKDGSMTGTQKAEYVLERVGKLIPENRKEIGTQIIRAIVEIVLIGIRLKGGAK
jgi:hypothetical protein